MNQQIVNIGDDEREVTLAKEGATWTARNGERSDTVEVTAVEPGFAELRVNGRRVVVPYLLDGGTVQFMLDGETWSAAVAPKGSQKTRTKEHSMSAPMPGMVLKIFVSAGDAVAHGKPLLVLEAMKMEHLITAPYDGVVRALHCKEGELVQPGIDLISVDPQEKG